MTSGAGRRIVMISDFYRPAVGGVERFVEDLSTQLTSRGYEVAVATQALEPTDLPLECVAGVRVYRLRGTTARLGRLFSRSDRPYAPPVPDPELVAGLARVMRAERPDVVHGHTWMAASVVPLVATRPVPLVMSVHDYAPVCARKTLLRGADELSCPGPRLDRCLPCAAGQYGVLKGTGIAVGLRLMTAFGRLPAAYLPVSDVVSTRCELRRSGVPVDVIPPFVADDLNLQAQAEPALGAALPDEPFLLFVGQLGRHKGLDVLLRAYAELDAPPPLVLIGARTPSTPTALPAGVRVLHDWPHGAVLEAWRRALIGVAPAVWPEPFGIAALEAMAFGTPLIASRGGGLAECIADGESGWLVPPDDAPALRAALQRLLVDAPLRTRLAQGARARAAAYTAAAVVPRYEAIYDRVLTPA